MPTGLISSYDLTVGVVVNMDEAIYLLSPDDTPLLTGMGSDGLSVISSRGLDERTFAWMDDSMLTPRSTLGAAVVTADTEVVLASAADRLKFSTNDVFRIAKAGAITSEVIRVTGYSATTSTTILVTRTFAGAAATTYATSSIVIGLGTALAEGSDPEAARSSDRSELTNNTQIFGPTSVHMSATEQVVRKYGVASEWTHQLMYRTKENAISREQAYIGGQRFDSTTLEVRTTGGLNYYITSVDTASTQLLVANIQTNQQTSYNRGGNASNMRIMANPVAFADMNDVGNTSIVRVTIEDGRRGRIRTAYIETEFGSVTAVRNRWMSPNEAVYFQRDNVVRRILRPFTFEMLAKTGDADKGQVVCEEGLEVKGGSQMFRYVGLAYSGSN